MPSGQRLAHQTATPNASRGSLTITESEAGPSVPFNFTPGTLRLRAEPTTLDENVEPTERRRIQWAEDVIDNEGMGKKSSKVCCIYHKPREAGESSSDDSSSSSSSDDSDSEPDTSRAQPAGRPRRQTRHPHNHDHGDEPCDADPAQDGPSRRASKGKQKARRPSPNAYERVPKKKEHPKAPQG